MRPRNGILVYGNLNVSTYLVMKVEDHEENERSNVVNEKMLIVLKQKTFSLLFVFNIRFSLFCYLLIKSSMNVCDYVFCTNMATYFVINILI